jgi:hypothetical protein
MSNTTTIVTLTKKNTFFETVFLLCKNAYFVINVHTTVAENVFTTMGYRKHTRLRTHMHSIVVSQQWL